MTTEEIAAQIHEVLPESVKSYFVIAEDENGALIARFCCHSESAREQINNVLKAVAIAGGIPRPQIVIPERAQDWMNN